VETVGVAEDKKNAEDVGAHIPFIDESGFLLIPSVRRTWGLRGHTPVHRHHYRRKKVSVISALTVSPKRSRIGLYFRCLPDANFDNHQVAGFLRHLMKHLRGFVIVIWDNGRCHKGDAMRAFLRRCRRIRIEALPPYAPELNPDEGVWNQTRSTLANSRPDDTLDLSETLSDVLTSLRLSQSNLRWCFHQSELPLFLA
jgi:transposase